MSIVETLRQAANGLLMMSESDYPFEPFLWASQGGDTLTNEKLLTLTGHSSAPVETVDLDYFFRNVASEKEWHDEIQKENVTKFQFLLQTLRDNLSDIQVYRVGTISIDVYIVGKTKLGDWAGLSTKVVET